MVLQAGRLHFSRGSKFFLVLAWVSVGFFAMKVVAFPGRVGLRLRPRAPTGCVARDVFHGDAIDRADRQTQLAAGAIGLDYSVPHLVAAQDGVGRAGGQAQGAANAPVLVNNGDASGPLQTVVGV